MMGSVITEKRILFLTQTGVGILGNLSLLCLYIFILITGHKLRPIDLIFNQLLFANALVLFPKEIPLTLVSLGWKFVLDDTGCKLVFYFHGVGRGVSLSTTCLLSGLQAIKLCPTVSRWMELKVRSSKCIGFCCFLSWILNLYLNIIVYLSMTEQLNSKNLKKKDFGYCSADMTDNHIGNLQAVMLLDVDVICLGLMAWASGSMVLVLHRHKHRVQHIHSNSLSPRPSRATRTILVLVSMFVSFYSLSPILTLCISLIVNPGQWLKDTSVLVASSFPAFSPFVLMISDARVSRFFAFCQGD
uniref:Vomeronasal type-1 receptor n=1 Tax=Loxodonta africana TaxID=9785 RepID=G3U6H0_LOXAF